MLGLHTLCRHAPGLSQWHAPDNRHGGRHSNVTIDDPAPRANLVGTGWERCNWYMTFFLGPFLEVFRGLFLNQSSAPWGNQGPARAILIFPGGAASQSRAGLAHQKSSSGISTAYDESPEPRMSPQAFPASPTGSLGPAQTCGHRPQSRVRAAAATAKRETGARFPRLTAEITADSAVDPFCPVSGRAADLPFFDIGARVRLSILVRIEPLC